MGEVRATFPHPRSWATIALCPSWNQFRSIDLFSPSERASQGNREAQEVQGSRSNIVPKRATAPWFPLLVRKHTPLFLRLRVAQFVHARSCSTHGSTPLLGSPFIFEARLWLWWWTPSSQHAGSPPIGISRHDVDPSRDNYLWIQWRLQSSVLVLLNLAQDLVLSHHTALSFGNSLRFLSTQPSINKAGQKFVL